MFEKLMNLDVELMCLGTKAFVAKEQFVSDVFHSRPKKSSEKEDKKEEAKAEVSDLMDKIQKDKAEGKDTSTLEEKLKEKMDEFLASDKEEEKPVTKEDISGLMSKIENEKANGKDTTKLEKELKDKMEKFVSSIPVTTAPVEKVEEPAVTVEVPVNSTGAKPRTDDPTVPDPGVTMDYSAQVQPGVTYEQPTNNPYIDQKRSEQNMMKSGQAPAESPETKAKKTK